MKTSTISVGIAGGLVALLFNSCAYQRLLKSKDYAFKLRKADEYYDNAKYEKAQRMYLEVSPFFKASDKYEYIAYRYAHCSFLLKDYSSSQVMFKDYLAAFPSSEHSGQAEYLQAKSFYLASTEGPYHLDPTNTNKAMNTLRVFLQNHPGTPFYAEATDMILRCMSRLELKDLRAAEQYYNMEQYNAAGIYYGQLTQKYPESLRVDEYKFLSIEAFYKFAQLSVLSRKKERYERVIKEYEDFVNRFPESKFSVRANVIYNTSVRAVETLSDELSRVGGQ